MATVLGSKELNRARSETVYTPKVVHNIPINEDMNAIESNLRDETVDRYF